MVTPKTKFGKECRWCTQTPEHWDTEYGKPGALWPFRKPLFLPQGPHGLSQTTNPIPGTRRTGRVWAGLPQPCLRVAGFQRLRGEASGHSTGDQHPRQELRKDARAVARDPATEAQGCQRGHMAGCVLPSSHRKL